MQHVNVRYVTSIINLLWTRVSKDGDGMKWPLLKINSPNAVRSLTEDNSTQDNTTGEGFFYKFIQTDYLQLFKGHVEIISKATIRCCVAKILLH